MSDYPDIELSAVPGLDPAEVEQALRRLPFLEREALLLKARDRLSYAEIGTVLGLTARQAEARTASGLVKLHRQLTRKRPAWWQDCRAILGRLLALRRGADPPTVEVVSVSRRRPQSGFDARSTRR